MDIVAENARLRQRVAELEARDELIKAKLIRMRHYIVRHGLLIGECVAWGDLKTMHGIGHDWAIDDTWFATYEAAHGHVR